MKSGHIKKYRAQRRIAVISVALIIFTALMLTLFSAIYYDRFTIETCTDNAKRFKAELTESLEYLDFDTLDDDGDKALLYDSLRQYLRRLCASSGIEYIYLFRAGFDDDNMHYIMSAAAEDDLDEVISRERGKDASIYMDDRSYIDKALEGELAGPERLNNEFGRELAYYFPMYDKQKQLSYIVGIDYEISRIRSQAIAYVVRTVLTVTVVLLVVMTVMLLVLRKKLFIPVRRIAEQMNSFDPEKEQEKLQLNSYYEIVEINESFNKLSGDIVGYIRNIRSMANERAKASAELSIARKIQIGMVPMSFSRSEPGYEIHAIACPAREVGGDLYDCFEADERVCTVIADVSGKGVAAALFMSMAKHIIRDRLKTSLDPARALNAANEELCAENPEGMFVTAFAAVLDTRTGEWIYANAGHTHPLISDSSGRRYLVPDTGIALGLFEDAGIVNESVILENGACVSVYTDGITEAVSKDNVLFGEERLLEAYAGNTAAEAVESVKRAVADFTLGNEQSDDMTMLALRFDAADRIVSERLAAEMPSLARMRSLLLDAAADFENKRHIALACEEIFVNIVDYSGTDTIGVIIGSGRGRLTVRFEDSGKPFDPLTEMPEEKEFDEYDTGGMGIRMMTKIADKLRYSRIGGRNILVMSFTSGKKEQ